jgi:glycosyltransferase involved in cell wall biosynthesis
MTAPTDVAVMIPAFGDSRHLREAVASVLAQDDDGWTLTVLDDGPEDLDLARWVGSLDDRICYRRNDPSLGINRNFQACVDQAAGDLLVVMGADDRMLPPYVTVMRRAATRHPHAAWFHPRVRVVDAAGRPVRPLADRVKARLALRPPAVVGGEQLAASLLRGNWMYFPAVTFRSDVVRRYGFRAGHDIVLDLDLYLRMIVAGESAVLVDDECFEYRRHDESLSSQQRTTGLRFAEERGYFAEQERLMRARGWARAARSARAHLTSRLHAASLLPVAAQQRRWATARSLLAHSVLP